LNEGNGHTAVERVNAFLALAEAGGSMQAKFARKELAGLSEIERIRFECDEYARTNGALANAYGTCVNAGRLTSTHHEDVNYGWDIVVRSLGVEHPGRRPHFIYQFFWTAYRHSPCLGQFKPSRYVEVKLNGLEIRLYGKPSDVMELAMRAKLFEIFPGSWYAGDKHLDQRQLAKGRLVREHKRPGKKAAA
jgi:hypothetical protein